VPALPCRKRIRSLVGNGYISYLVNIIWYIITLLYGMLLHYYMVCYYIIIWYVITLLYGMLLHYYKVYYYIIIWYIITLSAKLLHLLHGKSPHYTITFIT